MADIALIFHWPLASLDAMSVTELAAWRERAARRWEDPDKR